jgi:hypothetical protein
MARSQGALKVMFDYRFTMFQQSFDKGIILDAFHDSLRRIESSCQKNEAYKKRKTEQMRRVQKHET